VSRPKESTLVRFIAPFAAIAIVASTACSRGDDAATDTAAATGAVSGADTASAMPSMGIDDQRIASYRLSMDRVEKWAQAINNLQGISENDPELERWKERANATNGSLRDLEEGLEASPKIRRAIERAGISAEDFVLTQYALLQAAMVAGLQKGGVDTKLPANVSEENVKFYLDNEQQLNRLIEGLQANEGR
jgi:hypothetical protein